MRTRSVVAFELIIDVCRSAEGLFEEVSANERRRTVHLVERADVFRDFDVCGIVIEFLLDEFIAENWLQVFESHRLAGTRVQKRSGLLLHVGADVIPCLRKFIFVEISLDLTIDLERVSHIVSFKFV